jgi:hypothetical protein
MGEIFKSGLFAWFVLIAFCGEPALAAGTDNPISLSQPPKASRDRVAPQSPDAAHVTDSMSCRFVATEQGGTGGDCAGGENPAVLPAPGVDSAIIYKPVSEGKAQDRVAQDKVAPAGVTQDSMAAVGAHAAVGVLSSVKEIQIAAIDLLAFVSAFAKQLVLLLVVLPFLALKRLFQRGP